MHYYFVLAEEIPKMLISVVALRNKWVHNFLRLSGAITSWLLEHKSLKCKLCLDNIFLKSTLTRINQDSLQKRFPDKLKGDNTGLN